MKYLLTLTFIFSTLFSFSQKEESSGERSRTVDSLQQALNNFELRKQELHKNLLVDAGDTDKVKILNKLTWEYILISNYSSAKKNADDALAIAEQLSFKKGISDAYHTLATLNYYQGNYSEALKYYFSSLKIREEIGDKRGVGASYNNIGLAFYQQGNLSEGLKYYQSSLKIWKELGDKDRFADTYNNIGLIYAEQNNYDEALKNHFAALKIKEETGDQKGIANTYLNIGNAYSMKGNYNEALNYFSNSLKIMEAIGDKFGVATSYNNIGETNLRMGHAKKARESFVKSLGLAKEIESISQIQESYGWLAKADSSLGNFSAAYANHVLYDFYRDSLNNEEAAKKSLQAKLQYEFDKKQVADSLKFAQEKELVAERLKKQKAITYGWFSGVVITIVLLFFVYSNYIKQREANQKLKEAQEQIIKSEKMAAFGVMASRVSHEIQNPLNFVNNFSEIAEELVQDFVKTNNEQERLQTAKDLINNIQKIQHHGKRAESIVRELQEQSNKGTAQEFFEASS